MSDGSVSTTFMLVSISDSLLSAGRGHTGGTIFPFFPPDLAKLLDEDSIKRIQEINAEIDGMLEAVVVKLKERVQVLRISSTGGDVI